MNGTPLEPTLEIAAEPSRLRRWLVFALKLGLLAGIFAYLFYSGRLKPDSLNRLLSEWHWTAIAFTLAVPAVLVVSLRYWILLRTLGLEVSFRQALSFNMIGLFFDLVAPVGNGGDLVKVYYLGRTQARERWGVVLLSVVLDRVIGFFALFMSALIVCLAAWPRIHAVPRLEHLAFILVAVCLTMIVAFLVLVSERLEQSTLRKRLFHRLPYHEHLEHIYAAFAGLRRHPRALALMLVFSLCNHVFSCVGILLLAQGLPEMAQLHTVDALVVMPLALFLNSFGMAGGFGVGTAAFEGLFDSVLGIRGGGVLALEFQVVGLVFRLLGFPFWMMQRRNPGAEARPANGSCVPAPPQ